ncbi:sugar phosphate isomerase/epimerase [Microbacterium sp. SORGH_AS 1204]|uniref:sugar phosphate isomerase/epimerase family protein n=1 Tax=Microbacterium sp. SORGH_AS_1204 TaxID=3041785 RepID=UPI00278E24D5|nr:sugar phosphate isomerase/epimerase family protein [Microbacterium sp. SORGH_AS_1204]MDQ1135600.1 sugar phosphate isomerase/epimerase [Microbacterium sp. SORGH_AS_1204]
MSHHHDHAHPTVPDRPMSRRTLLKALAASSVAVGIGAAAMPAAASASTAVGARAAAAAAPVSAGKRLVPVNRIGIQLFTVRDKVSSLGFRAVFEELARIGYSEIEFAGYTQGNVGAITPQEIRQLLDDNGLRAAGSHVNLNPGNIDQQLEIAHILGTPHLGQGGAIAQGITSTAWRTAAQTWNGMGEKAKAAGIKLYAHNHAGEFAITSDTQERIYDLLWDEFDRELVFFEMDVYWAHVGKHLYPGFEPIDYIKRDPRRFPILHLKDGKLNPNVANGYEIVEFGAGNIDYTAFLSQLRDRGQRYGMYEQDNASTVPINPGNSLANADRSYDNIAALRG